MVPKYVLSLDFQDCGMVLSLKKISILGLKDHNYLIQKTKKQ